MAVANDWFLGLGNDLIQILNWSTPGMNSVIPWNNLGPDLGTCTMYMKV